MGTQIDARGGDEVQPIADGGGRSGAVEAGASACEQKLVPRLVLEGASRRADALALVGRSSALTYGELAEIAMGTARRLRGAGVRRESIVAIAAEPGPDMVVAQLAAWLAGGAYLPLDPSYPRARLEFMLGDSGATLLLDGAGLGISASGGRPATAPQTMRTWSLKRALSPLSTDEDRTLPVQWEEGEAKDLAYLLYTSGSTGRPKGVLVEHAALLNYVRWDVQAFDLGPRDRVSQTIAPSFDMSVWEIWPTLVAGASLHFAVRADYARPGALWRWIAEERITVSVLATPLAEQLLKETSPERLDLRCMLVAGDRLRSFAGKKRPFALFNLYGPTETTMNVTCGRVPEEAPAPLALPSIGRAIAGAELHVLDDRGQPVPTGVAGELYIGGPGLARGYHQLPELTRDRFVEAGRIAREQGSEGRRAGQRLYRTGDRVRLTEHGELEFLGRLDQQVKLRGHRIELGEIEAVLVSRASVRSAVVLLEGERLCAFVVPQPDRSAIESSASTPDADELMGYLRARVPAYMVPSKWVFLDHLPLTPNGKIDRNALRARGAEARGSAEAIEEQEEDTDGFRRKLAQLWREVLEAQEIGEDAEFFALGGHSLTGLALMARIQHQLALSVGLSDLIVAPTFGAFCQRLAMRRSDAAPVELPESLSHDGPGDPASPFPLTDVQHAYWVGRQAVFPLGDVATHLYFEREGRLDIAQLEDALNRLIQHHGMLRSIVREDGQQQVLSDVPRYVIRVSDHRQTSVEERERHLASVREELSHQVLSADRWPLFDIRATLLPAGSVRLHLSFDALILDAQSLFRLLDEWHRLVVDPGRELLPARATFGDYMRALEAQKTTSAYALAREYWRGRIETLPAEPELPLRPASERGGPTRFVRRTMTLSRERWGRLRRRAHAQRVTETVALLCAYADIVAGFAKSPHFLLNLTLFDRRALVDDVASIVGDFTSISLLEIDARTGCRFRERAAHVQARLFQDLDRRAYSGVQVLRDCAAQRERISAPVVFTSELGFEALGRDTSVLDRFGREVYAITQTPQVWIDLQVVEREGELVAYWDAVEELFLPGVLDAMFEAFRDKVVALAQREEAWEAESWLPVAGDRMGEAGPSACEQNTESRGCPRDRGAALHAGMIERALCAPERVAVVQGARTVRYGELLTWARAIAASLGVCEASTLIGVELPKSPVQIAAVFGVLMSGAAYVPIDPAWPLERRRALLRTAGIKTLLTSPDGATYHAADEDLRILVAASVAETGGGQAFDAVLDPQRLAYVIFTSGSTGMPKGVMVTHEAAWNTLADVRDRMGVNAQDRVLCVSALSFDLSVFDIFGTLAAGATLVLPDPERARDPEHLRECVVADEITLWNSVPALAELLIDQASPEDLRSLRVVMLSGDWIAVDLPGRFWRLCPDVELYSLGGATEAAIWSIVHRIEGTLASDWTSIPYGRAMRGQKVEVLDAQFAKRPPWVSGEICIGGCGVAEGYLGDAERTARAFVLHPRTGERWYRTGDLGCYRPDGVIELLGREDNQVKINGFRIELGEVDAALRSHAGVARCVALATGPRGRRRILSAVVPRGPLEVSDLREHLRKVLPEYMLPSRIVVVESLPTTANGKIDQKAVLSLCEASSRGRGETGSSDGAVEARGTAREQTKDVAGGLARDQREDVARAWADVLGIASDEIDLDLNFFDAGGDSVSAVRLRSRLAALVRHAVSPLPLTFVFEHATIREQARQLSRASGIAAPLHRGPSAAERARRRRAAQGAVPPVQSE